jgi:predicted flap endonuclease-1-like 5' DNA nuclease
MIIHIAEVWFALFVAFVVGCLAGTFLYRWIRHARSASTRSTFAAAAVGVGDRTRASFRRTRATHRLDSGTRNHAASLEAEAAEAASPWDDLDDLVAPAAVPLPDIEDDARWVSTETELDQSQPAAVDVPHQETTRTVAVSHRPEPAVERASRAAAVDDRRDEPHAADSYGSPTLLPPPQTRWAFVEEPERPPLPHVRPASATPDDAPEVRRPATLQEPRNGVPDNLQRIRGIGERNEIRLNQLGVFHFSQIASWTAPEIRWIGERLAFPERIERDDWVGQAIVLASGGETGFTKSAERRRERRRGGLAVDENSDEDPMDEG